VHSTCRCLIGNNRGLPVSIGHEAEGDSRAHEHDRQRQNFGPTTGTPVSTFGHTAGQYLSLYRWPQGAR
jgi:hypothetical protein